ncbi:GOLPH3/VPS74 family protein [Streptomyces ochraceiscleroticus]|uniref:GPP34 family phosphoprotein n=1 Tax=Streptomyces ochraceiscleroticus TaxID=47761 RepID=A0ABW1MWS7_9ACTN|nr:GPP34 family phosphoprotein [Streptomyces ochraceiscleroticus]
MSTARDLVITALDVPSRRSLQQGELSLALAGAELIDLLAVQAVGLDGEDIVPGYRPAMDDRLLDEAAASLVRQAPYETVEEWLWRRGRGLYSAYLAELEADGQIARQRGRWMLGRAGQVVPVDSPERLRAADRWASGEPTLITLATAVGIGGGESKENETSERNGENGGNGGNEESPRVGGDAGDDPVVTVLAVVSDALRELEAVRQRRAIEDAAFDNVWRGGI